MTSVNELLGIPCGKLDAHSVDAYLQLLLDPENPSRLILDSSWGESSVDLSDAIKYAETITHLFLTDTALQYNREDYGREEAPDDGIDCIEGDALSRIISMRYLKDVKQIDLRTGDVYMFNETTNLFEPFALQDFVDETNNHLNILDGRVNTLETTVDALKQQVQDIQVQVNNLSQTVANLTKQLNDYITKTDQRLATIEATIAKPSWAPSAARITWGTINNLYNADPNNKGIYNHDPANNVVGDEKFQ